MHPWNIAPSILVLNPEGWWQTLIVPGLGWKFLLGSSALILHSIAWPLEIISIWFKVVYPYAAMLICSFTISIPVTTSETGCSTWILVFISKK